MINIDKQLDVRGLNCPLPVLKARKTLKEMGMGQVLEILASDPGSMNDIPAWARTTKQELLVAEERGSKDFRYVVKRLN
ncbi:MAG: sulfurtransferase TusA family protein [Candidatus Odinarchaeota archaeon]